MTKLQPGPERGRWSFAACHLPLVLLCLVAVWPLLRAAPPCSHDASFHYFRVAAMRYNLQNGVLFTRYLPDLAFGYGYPFFNYRAPLPYYLALGLYLTGMPLPLALNLVYVLAILGCALGAFLLARDLFGARAGIVAAVAYAYSPYLFLDSLLRANMPESVALALLPFALWAFRRLVLEGGRRWFLAAAGLLAALLLTHNISSLLFLPYLLVYLGVLGAVYRRRGRWAWVVLALVMGLGMAAFFWLPALAEKGYVQLDMSLVTRNNDFHYNLLGPAEIFAPPAPVDTSLMNPPMEIHLGLVQALLAGLGLVAGLAAGRRVEGSQEAGPQEMADWWERRADLLFFATSAAFFLFLSTPASLWLWENMPLLPFVQFPWRFVGRAALPVALLAGASVPAVLPTRRAVRSTQYISGVLLPVLILLLILAAFPDTYPPLGYCPTDPYPTIRDVHRYERQSTLVGVDPEGSYFPVWVAERPDGSPLEGQYEAGGTVARFDVATLPEGAAVLEADYGANRARLVVESPVPFRARYLAFYFPGWRVWVDGERVEIAPTDPQGLISFDVPAGRHTVTVRFGETTLRLVADLLSAVALLALVVLAVRCPTPPTRLLTQPTNYLIPLALLLLAFKLAVVDRVETPFRRPLLQDDGTLPGVGHPLSQPYGDGLTLIGYDWSGTEMPADGTLSVDLYWTVRRRPSRSYRMVVYLVGPDGFLWSQPGIIRPRGYHRPLPTHTWQPGLYALDSHEVEPLSGTPPGTYSVVATVFDRETLVPLSVLDEAGQPAAPDLALGEITLARPDRPTPLPSHDRLDLPLDEFTLLTVGFDRDLAAPGDSILLTMLWQAGREAGEPPRRDIAALSLLAPDGSVAASYPLPYPVPSWEPGDVWRSQHRLALPATLEGGAHTWLLEWGLRSSYSVGRVSIEAPERVFVAPPMDVEIGARLGEIATLAGFSLEPTIPYLQPGASVTVTIVWQAESTADESYHVFLHLLDPGGRLVAQSDGVPAAWTRPTTGWLPGEVITDTRVLSIPSDAPPGGYTIQAGLYLPSGARLATPEGSDAVPLTTISVQSP